MTTYTIALFIHIVGALALFVALGLEWAGLLLLRGAMTSDQARAGITVLRMVPRFAIPALPAILLPGLYMTADVWGWSAGWPPVALATMALIAVLGGALTGRRIAAAGKAIAGASASMLPSVQQRLHDPLLVASLRLRTALALGIVSLMTIKPDTGGSLLAIGVAALLGLATTVPLWSRQMPEPVTTPAR